LYGLVQNRELSLKRQITHKKLLGRIDQSTPETFGINLMSIVNSLLVASVLLHCAPSWARAPGRWIAPEQGIVARHLVEEFRFERLSEMEDHGLTQAQVREEPWSGWYWSFDRGGLAFRYADAEFPRKENWGKVRSYIEAKMGLGHVSDFSPAEKYDLLVGDPQFTLTRTMIKNASHQAVKGVIEPWIGFCTGLAAASVSFARPERSVRLLAQDGITVIEFRPDDIKALGALLWSKGVYPFRVAGKTCSEEPVVRDPANDRPLDKSCRETNPATLHLTMVNQIGVSGRPPIIDADPGYQIWNHAVKSYSYSYFHPLTQAKVDLLSQARTPIEEMSKDPFRGTRAPGTRWIVGVEMEVEFFYVSEPERRDQDSADRDVIRKPVYRYELELDIEGRIIGGEWLTRLRPDVIWVVGKGVRAETSGDQLLMRLPGGRPEWNSKEPLPAEWAEAAKVGAARSQPLRHIVERLFELSSGPAINH
jgi:hypothetical protein